ncbi:MAG: hypothetical protein C0608_00710 [Deltaproteobacteria bacterium]|nr:MAG: hypothetical protein C0608_00710 [Deltaproteobacteria bacterium]
MKKKALLTLLVVALAVGAALVLEGVGERSVTELESSTPDYEARGKFTFFELGSVGCKPCEAMKEVMAQAGETFGDNLEIIFHDVKADPKKAAFYKISLIPTQIIVDPLGVERYRHEGYLYYDKLEEVLLDLGVEKR